jgi:hypothetical protein
MTDRLVPCRPWVNKLPALALTGLLTSTLTCPAAPVSRIELAAQTHPAFKMRFTSLTAATTTVTPQSLRSRDGQRRTEVVVHFTHLTIRGLCFSLRKDHRGTAETIRINTPELRAGELTLGLDSLDDLGVLGQQLDLRKLPTIAGAPLSQPREPGFLPIQLGKGLFNVGGTFRWVNSHDFRVEHLGVHSTPPQQECY